MGETGVPPEGMGMSYRVPVNARSAPMARKPCLPMANTGRWMRLPHCSSARALSRAGVPIGEVNKCQSVPVKTEPTLTSRRPREVARARRPRAAGLDLKGLKRLRMVSMPNPEAKQSGFTKPQANDQHPSRPSLRRRKRKGRPCQRRMQAHGPGCGQRRKKVLNLKRKPSRAPAVLRVVRSFRIR